MLPIRTILHATDFSEYSENAFQLACALARDYGARLLVLHVVLPPTVVYGGGIVPPEPEAYRAQMKEKLHQLQAGDPKVAVEHQLTEGDPAAEILRVARESNCDLIVIGTHGRTGLGRLLMGSVAERVMRQAPCPILTAKMPFALTQLAEASLSVQTGETMVAARS